MNHIGLVTYLRNTHTEVPHMTWQAEVGRWVENAVLEA